AFQRVAAPGSAARPAGPAVPPRGAVAAGPAAIRAGRRGPTGRLPGRRRRAAGRRTARCAGTMAAADPRRPGRTAAAQIPLRTTAAPGTVPMNRLLCALLLCLLGLQAWAASFTATVDRARLNEGETFDLILESEDATQFGMPDLAPLRQQFEIVST